MPQTPPADSGYLTITFVVRADGRPAADLEFFDARALVTNDETMFYAVSDGVSADALALGAQPGDWDDDPDDGAAGAAHAGAAAERMETAVSVAVDGRTVGQVSVQHDEGTEPVQLAATAHAALGDATFTVAGQTFTAGDIDEWWA